MAYSNITYEVDDRVARITLNRPKKMNALSIKLREEFQDAVANAENDSEVRVILVSAAGGRAFSAGFDVSDGDSASEQRTVNEWKKLLDNAFKFHYTAFNCSKPVVGMIEGYCLGGALDFISMFDLRYCADDARFGAVEVRYGLGVQMLSLPWVIGQRCRELMYTGDTFDAQEAFRLGLVNRVFPKHELEREVVRIAKRISRVSLPTLQWHKRALNNAMNVGGFDSALRYGNEASVLIEASDSEFKRYPEIRNTQGMAAANEWLKSIFAPFESESKNV